MRAAPVLIGSLILAAAPAGAQEDLPPSPIDYVVPRVPQELRSDEASARCEIALNVLNDGSTAGVCVVCAIWSLSEDAQRPLHVVRADLEGAVTAAVERWRYPPEAGAPDAVAFENVAAPMTIGGPKLAPLSAAEPLSADRARAGECDGDLWS